MQCLTIASSSLVACSRKRGVVAVALWFAQHAVDGIGISIGIGIVWLHTGIGIGIGFG